MSTNIQKIIKQSKDPKFMGEVFEFAKKVYGDKKRSTEESFIDHVTNVALILSNMGLDKETVAAGVLHDAANADIAPEKDKALLQIQQNFGATIRHIVEKTSNLHKIYYSFRLKEREENFSQKEKAENLIKMFLAVAADVRVILIELAARMDGLQKLHSLPPEKQRMYAVETLAIFVPISNRLGLGGIKRALEDPAFAFLFPEKFAWLQSHLKEKYEERQAYLKKFIPQLKKLLKHEKIAFSLVDYRAKSYWSTYQKLERHQMNFEKLHDLVAMRVVVNDVLACYKVLGILHKHFQPISGHIQDYIAKPKENGYKSLHTTVFLEEGKISEIQIKTDQMHQEAEHGICAHWAYKEKIQLQGHGEHLAWTRGMPEFLKHFNIDFYADKIFAFTPKGDIIMLPKGSTPVDFAYAVHSDVGNHCESAKIGGKIIPLSQALNNGDVVEIITNKKRKPSADWLKFIQTNLARVHVKKETLLKIPASLFSIPAAITKKIFGIGKKPNHQPLPAKKTGSLELHIAGQKSIMVNFAKCCNPRPGDQAKAYLTKHRAAVLHKSSCQNFQKLSKNSPEKVVEASWHQS